MNKGEFIWSEFIIYTQINGPKKKERKKNKSEKERKKNVYFNII